jgi:hypothetical protein
VLTIQDAAAEAVKHAARQAGILLNIVQFSFTLCILDSMQDISSSAAIHNVPTYHKADGKPATGSMALLCTLRSN